MTIAGIILAVLKLVFLLLETAQQNKWIKVGEDRQIAAAAVEVLRKTSVGKSVLAEMEKLDDKQVDDVLRSLEPRKPE